MSIEQKLIKAGVCNLKEFGYTNCNEENILTDTVYKAFFESMLKDNIGASGIDVDHAINGLLDKIKED